MVRLLPHLLAYAKATGIAFLLCAACKSKTLIPTSHPFSLRVTDAPGEPLPGVVVKLGERMLGVTGPDGTLKLKIDGLDGQRFQLKIACPANYHPAKEPTIVSLFDYASGAPPEIATHCEAERVSQGVVVRTTGATNIPIVLRGRRVAVTDTAGVAHVLVNGEPGEHVDLVFDTSQLPDLRPTNPTVAVVLSSHDDAGLAEQHFELKPAPKKHVAVVAKPKITGPIRIH